MNAARAATSVAMIATLLSACSGEPARPNVALIVLDTTRPDRLSLYGYPRPTSPSLDALAAESTVYDQAYSTSAWTPPAHASLLTGLYPHTHGVTQSAWHLPLSQVTLAERLWDAGYETIGIVGNPMVGQAFGWSQGFEQYHETWRETAGADAVHPAIAQFRQFLDQPRARPFFAFFNFNEPHSPYSPPDEPRAAWLDDRTPARATNDWRRHFTGARPLSETAREQLGDLYDAEVQYADQLVAEVTQALSQRGLLDDTVLVITSDHGENLGEHGMVDHVFSLYETTVRVPLLVRYPPRFPAGERVASPVQLVDVYATLSALAGVETPGGQGIDLLLAKEQRERPVLLRYAYPQQALGTLGPDGESHPALAPYRHGLWAIREGDRKLILSDDGTMQLFDLATDPNETTDLSEREPARRDHLRAQITRLLIAPERGTSERSAPTVEVDEATLEELRALGYAQ
jgi:arylsulfatase A-like enzyme